MKGSGGHESDPFPLIVSALRNALTPTPQIHKSLGTVAHDGSYYFWHGLSTCFSCMLFFNPLEDCHPRFTFEEIC